MHGDPHGVADEFSFFGKEFFWPTAETSGTVIEVGRTKYSHLCCRCSCPFPSPSPSPPLPLLPSPYGKGQTEKKGKLQGVQFSKLALESPCIHTARILEKVHTNDDQAGGRRHTDVVLEVRSGNLIITFRYWGGFDVAVILAQIVSWNSGIQVLPKPTPLSPYSSAPPPPPFPPLPSSRPSYHHHHHRRFTRA